MHRFTILGVIAASLVALPAHAQVNLGFEDGLNGWTQSNTGNGGATVVTSHGSFAPKEGNHIGRIIGGCYTNSLSQTFSLAAGTKVSGWAGFDGGDYMPYNDSAAVNVSSVFLNSQLWYVNISQVGNFGDKAWTQWSFQAPATGNYSLVLSSSNSGDCGVNSYALFDGAGTVACADSDADGVCDDKDNCKSVPNKDQANADGDAQGNACDNCPGAANSDQADQDGDGDGNVCDNCPNVANSSQADGDGDAVGDSCDNCAAVSNANQANADGDVHGDACDNCAGTPNDDQANSDTDGHGDACDNCDNASNQDQSNVDGDAHGDACDNCAGTPNDDQANGDTDGHGDACDNCDATANQDQSNADSDAHGDACDNCAATANDDQANGDADSQGDVCDNCALVTNEDQSNLDADAFGDVCDICPLDGANDADDDGICGNVDHCAGTGSTDGAPSLSLGVNRFADTNGDGVFDTTSPKGKGPGRSYSIKQTAGCNCSQIIALQGLGEGHSKYGCSISAMDDFVALMQSIGLGN